jgi:outer membrane protein
VWQAYHNLSTGAQAVRSSNDLVASATASERLALGRYKAGAGSIIDLVTAQSALASARQQNIQALYNLSIFKAVLAQALGRIDWEVLNDAGSKP